MKNSKKMSQKEYEEKLEKLQIELLKFQYYVKEKGLKVLIIMEGRDASGKGSTIKRITQHLNPRGCRIVALNKPSDVENTQWYFQRYIAHLPSGGEIVIFDRSWYNRAMVEPVMGFCTQEQYENFLEEVPELERLLYKSDIIIFKFFLTINKDTQAKRFKERLENPLKSYKISIVDQKAQELWDEYTIAQFNMFLKTDTKENPWIVIDSNNKKTARLNTIKEILRNVDFKDKPDNKMFQTDNAYVRTAKEEIKRPEYNNLNGNLKIKN